MVDPSERVRPLEVVNIRDWTRFAETVNSRLGEINAGRFVFRGQPDNEFSLASSFDRRFANLTPLQRDRIGKRIEGIFRSTAERVKLSLPVGTNELMCTGQHFGLATRMLDWSESRYVAAFFAFSSLVSRFDSTLAAEGAPEDQKVSVFALDDSNALWSQDTIQILRAGGTGNKRLRRQRGLFTVNHTQFASIEDYMNDYCAKNPGEIDRTAVYRFDMSVRFARGALRDMQEMRISHSELFPGLEGVARETMLAEWLNDA